MNESAFKFTDWETIDGKEETGIPKQAFGADLEETKKNSLKVVVKTPLFVSTLASPTSQTQTKACQRANKASPKYRLCGRFWDFPTHKKQNKFVLRIKVCAD